ncbi:GtrA family protein [Amycolatopsis carbonis]|uniref:GtrA family protein n=1 Tax=Amycolatopsis carbonis TaxID=715471 RepID=A0A9Y2N0N7_9PSEU|nr:GtrA family protein [Amycolatopsis sp. 2-15]WIX82254.1 GtrA family protein [Amycolatopsis sp. 2-15]
MKLLTAQQIRFGVVGIANTLVDAVGFALLYSSVGLPLFVANLCSTTAGMLLSFVLNRNFTFRAQDGDVRKQVVLFFASTAFGLWVVQAAVIFAVGSLLPHVTVLVPKFAGIAVGLVWNYVLYQKVVFRQRTAVPVAATEPPGGTV